MKLIRVDLKENSYDIAIGANKFGVLPKLITNLDLGNHAIIVTNTTIKKLFGRKITSVLSAASIKSTIVLVPDSEKSKSIKELLKLINKAVKIDVKRRLFIIALGGGVIGDLAGFAAAIYKRGIPYVQIPTTLLGQVDSSIGGKVAVDLPEGKNLIGAFYQPRLVFADTSTLKSLSARQVKSGLAEIIKYGIISDASIFDYIEHNYRKVLELNDEALIKVIGASAAIKADVVSKDEKEKTGLRTILNFGHTIGHAIEAALGYSSKYTHGEAISVGMVCAADIAVELKLCSKKTQGQIESLLSIVGLPIHIKGVSLAKIMKTYLHDKKFIRGKNRFVLPEKIGKVKVVEDIPEKIIKEVVLKRIKRS